MDVKKIRTIAATVLVLITILKPAAGLETEEAKVTEAIRLLFVALENEDVARFRSITSSDFYAFDAGKRFSRDELFASIKNAHSSGKIYAWKVTEPEAHIDGNTAWITYMNRGSVQDDSGKKSVAWLESAVLRKESGGWRIHFLHSTRLP